MERGCVGRIFFFTLRAVTDHDGLTERQCLLLFVALVVIAAAIVTGVSYVDEDAFISFRTVDNAVHGYGLRYNVDERVQPFTNPLWVLAMIPLYAAFGDMLAASFVLSIVCSTAAYAAVAWELRRRPLLLAIAFSLPLFLSRAFTDYTNAGFENPLTFLFVALFSVRFLRCEEPVPWRPLTALTALLAVNRLDAVLLLLPAMAWLFFSHRREARYRDIVVGALPLALWLLFSLFYFGMAFPNTKYAKLDAGFGLLVYLGRGWLYLKDVARNDTLTLAGILAGAGAAIACLRRALRERREGRGTREIWGRLASLGAGALLSSCYVVYIGGDFMMGRHWSSPFFLAILVLVFALRELGLARPAPVLAAALGAFASHFALQPMITQRDALETREQGRFAIVREGGIRDQRFNCSFFGALFGARGPEKEHSWAQLGLRYRDQAKKYLAENPGGRFVVVHGGAGATPFHAGPDVIFVDPLAITDPLLARLPDADGRFWFPGHLERHVPDGYVRARQTGSLDGMDPELAAYYRALRHIQTGPLLDPARLVEIVRFNLGQYDGHLAAYLAGAYRTELSREREAASKKAK
jgi:arabinofuranosyltransferase